LFKTIEIGIKTVMLYVDYMITRNNSANITQFVTRHDNQYQ